MKLIQYNHNFFNKIFFNVCLLLIFTNKIIAIEKFDIHEAVKYAICNAFDIKTAETQVKIVQEKIKEAKASLGPKLSIEGNYKRIFRSLAVTVPLGPGGALETIPVILHNNTTGGANISLPIDAFGINKRAVIIAQKIEEATVEDLYAAINTVKHDTRVAYYKALQAKGLISVAEFSKKDIKERLDNTRKLFEVGENPKIDVTRFESEYQRSQGEYVNAENNLKLSKNALNAIIGRCLDEDFDPIEENHLPEICPLKTEDWVCCALANRYEIQSLKNNISAQNDLIFVTKGATLPSLEFNGNYNRTFFKSQVASLPYNMSVGATLQWTLYDSGATQAKVKEVEEGVNKLKIALDKLIITTDQQVRNALLQLQNAKQQILIAEKAMEFASESLRIINVSFQAGEALTVEVIDAESTMKVASNNLINAKSAYLIAYADLQLAIGIDDLCQSDTILKSINVKNLNSQ